MSHEKKCKLEDDGFPGIGNEVVEYGTEVLSSRKPVGKGFHRVVQGPPSHHTIERQHKDSTQDTHEARYDPGFSGRQCAIGPYGVCLAATPYDKLGQHHRHGQQENETEINDDEGGTAIITNFRGKAPDIAQPHSRACRGQYHAQATSEVSSF